MEPQWHVRTREDRSTHAPRRSPRVLLSRPINDLPGPRSARAVTMDGSSIRHARMSRRSLTGSPGPRTTFEVHSAPRCRFVLTRRLFASLTDHSPWLRRRSVVEAKKKEEHMDGRRAGVVVVADRDDDDEAEEAQAPHPPVLGAPEVGAVGAEANNNGPDPGAAPPEAGVDGPEDDEFRAEWPRGFLEAANLLDDADGSPIHSLYVSDMRIAANGEDARSFPRFVTLLGQREGARTVRRISFRVDWRRLPPGDVVRLFGDVLPAHPTLKYIGLNIKCLPARYLKILTEALPTKVGDWLLSEMGFLGAAGGEEFDQENRQEICQAIVDMLNRNVALSILGVEFPLDANRSKLICQALANTNLFYLSLNVTDVFADSLDGVATSSLRQLRVRGSFSDDALPSLLRQLRTNETLWGLILDETGNGRRDSQALLDHAKTYNYKLQVHGNLGSRHTDARVRERFEQITRRNRRIRRGLPFALRREVVPTRLLPRVLGLVSDLPTLLYRILRSGHVKAVSELLLAVQNGDGDGYDDV